MNIFVTVPDGQKFMIHTLIAISDHEIRRIVGVEFRQPNTDKSLDMGDEQED